jgi:hypothetical protein
VSKNATDASGMLHLYQNQACNGTAKGMKKKKNNVNKEMKRKKVTCCTRNYTCKSTLLVSVYLATFPAAYRNDPVMTRGGYTIPPGYGLIARD